VGLVEATMELDLVPSQQLVIQKYPSVEHERIDDGPVVVEGISEM
jgi:hypothetical protein